MHKKYFSINFSIGKFSNYIIIYKHHNFQICSKKMVKYTLKTKSLKIHYKVLIFFRCVVKLIPISLYLAINIIGQQKHINTTTSER